MLKEFMEKQYFIVNMDVQDIADGMIENENKTLDEIESEDVAYVQILLREDNLTIKKLEASSAIIKYNREERILYITLGVNNQKYKLSLLEFLEYNKYKKITSYFLVDTQVILRDVSPQMGGVIDKNYGFKFMISI